MIEYNQITTTSFILTEEGNTIASEGSHEVRVWSALSKKGEGEPIGIPQLQVSPHEFHHLRHSMVQ